jgi:large subunit ribosomal protein L24
MQINNSKLHVKKGDKVKVITGSNRGKEGVIAKTFPKLHKVVIEGVNVVKKHAKGKKQNEKGQIVEVSMPIDSSNVKKI